MANHLGGHSNITNIDLGLLDFIKYNLNCKSFIDIGCGLGDMVDAAQNISLEAYGIDGDNSIKRTNKHILIIDYTKNSDNLNKQFDIGYSCEFLEHVEEKYMNNYMKTFQKCKFIVITAAPENWPGHHHVNCKNHQYWINKFNRYGFLYHLNTTMNIRNISTMNNKKPYSKQFMKQRALFFVNHSFIKNPIFKIKLDNSHKLLNVFYVSIKYEENEVNEPIIIKKNKKNKKQIIKFKTFLPKTSVTKNNLQFFNA